MPLFGLRDWPGNREEVQFFELSLADFIASRQASSSFQGEPPIARILFSAGSREGAHSSGACFTFFLQLAGCGSFLIGAAHRFFLPAGFRLAASLFSGRLPGRGLVARPTMLRGRGLSFARLFARGFGSGRLLGSSHHEQVRCGQLGRKFHFTEVDFEVVTIPEAGPGWLHSTKTGEG
jgi:hypothetical protein